MAQIIKAHSMKPKDLNKYSFADLSAMWHYCDKHEKIASSNYKINAASKNPKDNDKLPLNKKYEQYWSEAKAHIGIELGKRVTNEFKNE